MGMYTQLVFGARLDKEKSSEILPVIRYMLDIEKEDAFPEVLPEHPLFRTSRWRNMLLMSSAYFDLQTHSVFDEESAVLSIVCNLKNYEYEIELFLDWIDPYLDHEPKDFLGFSRCEETEEPTLIYKK